ncbi:nucleoside diphosphate kinase [Phascolomyces articulosus]|uniref:Nucleoside diphosphate kinase n=1 Tax=Phascolomyces articulosus TaxID=60185 RepID=A0AAD5PJ44_9FUNG|nr:nucleoside diphosphate kinase [Phascolomyces articulosus]
MTRILISLIPCVIGILYYYLSTTQPEFKYKACQDLERILQPAGTILLHNNIKNVVCPVEETLLVFKPDGVIHKAMVMDQLHENYGFQVVQAKSVHMTKEMVDRWYHELRSKDFYPELQHYLTRGPCYAVLLKRVDAIRGLRYWVGPTDPGKGKLVAPWSIRAHIGTSIQENAVHASDSKQAVEREKAILF